MSKKYLIMLLICLFTIGIVPVNSQTNCSFGAATWHPSSTLVAVACDTTIKIYSPAFEINQEIQLSPEPPDTFPRITNILWSPDGTKLAASIIRNDTPGSAGLTSQILIWDVASGLQILEILDRRDPIAWNPNGSYIATTSLEQAGNVYLYDLQTASESLICTFCGRDNITWNPVNNNQIAVSSGVIETTLLDPFNPITTMVTISGSSIYGGKIYSPSGTRVLLTDPDTFDLEVWDISTRQVVSSISRNMIGNISSMSWQPGGIFINTPTQSFAWDGISQVVSPLAVSMPIMYWSPDGSYVLSRSNIDTIYIYNPLNGEFIAGINSDGTLVPNPTSCDSTISASDISSLISAINTGNNVAAPYSICLADSVYTLNAVDNSDSIGANALPVITGDISIIGNGATLERAVSAPDFRFLRVENGATLTLENLTLNNGHTSGTSDAGDGGAIYNDGTLTLDSVILTNNTANIEAGAIYNNDAQILTITNSSFTGNHALGDDGGAIDNHGTATISSTTFADNHADSDDGGAIWNDDNAILTISDSIFSLNTAFDEGGIIMNFGTISLTNNIIANNSSGDDGGAISSDSGSITVTNGNFSNNISGDDGGAIMTYAPLNLSGVTLDGNQSSDKGGAIYVWDSDLIIDNSTLSNNISINNGGAIYIGNAGVSSYLLNSCVFGNTAGNTSGVYAENDNFDATFTWWGAIDGPAGSGTGSGDEVNSNVKFANFVATNCADAMSATTQTQSLAILANTVADSSNFPIVSLPYSNNFADNSDLSGSVRWTRDETGWLLDSDIRGQSSSLEMTIWVELSNNPQINLSYLERADLASNDVITLEIQVQGSSDWVVLSQNIGTNYDWQEANISLADYRGETIRLRWTADIPADAPPGENSLSYAIDELQISR